MKSRAEIERLTENALSSLDNLQQVEANEFLYGKIINRMHTHNQQERAEYSRLMLRLSFALVLFTGLNVVSFYAFQHQKKHVGKPVASSAAAFAQEYSLTGDSYNY